MTKRHKPKRVKWTYEAEIDYIHECGSKKGEWVMGFLDEEGNPYECPRSSNVALVDKVKELYLKPSAKWVRVTVETNEKMDRFHKEYPTLINIEAVKRRQKKGQVMGELSG